MIGVVVEGDDEPAPEEQEDERRQIVPVATSTGMQKPTHSIASNWIVCTMRRVNRSRMVAIAWFWVKASDDALGALPEEESERRQDLGNIEAAQDAGIVGEPPDGEMTRVGGHELGRVELAAVVAVMRHVPDLQDMERAAEKDGVNAAEPVIGLAVVQKLVVDGLMDEQPAHHRRIAIDQEIGEEGPAAPRPDHGRQRKAGQTGTGWRRPKRQYSASAADSAVRFVRGSGRNVRRWALGQAQYLLRDRHSEAGSGDISYSVCHSLLIRLRRSTY